MSQPGHRSRDYATFVKKFEESKAHTTDDCLTPPELYDAVLSWCMERYRIPETARIVRPFYPGGDYEALAYEPGDVVIDNPPFSIMSRIVRFYEEKGVPFVLFCQGQTAASATRLRPGLTIVLTGASPVYANGATVMLALVTNLSPETRVELAATLARRIRALYPYPKEIKSHKFPPGITNSARLGTMAKFLDYRVREADYIDRVDGYHPFGGGICMDPEELERLADMAREKGARI